MNPIYKADFQHVYTTDTFYAESEEETSDFVTRFHVDDLLIREAQQ